VLEVMTGNGESRTREFPAINAHGACVAGFSDALLDGREFVPSGIDGLRSAQITDAMARSAREGVHVRLAY
jgi:predicted dehydrogenase